MILLAKYRWCNLCYNKLLPPIEPSYPVLNVTSPEHIFIHSAFSNQGHAAKPSSIGQANVLDHLLPALTETKAKLSSTLEKVDSYMLLETRLLLDKLQDCFAQASIPEDTLCQLSYCNGTLLISDGFELKVLNHLINQDKWSVDAFGWLHPNYIGLAHSMEWMDFSVLYAKNRKQAIETYAHFDQHDQGLCCQLRYCSGSLQMVWQSPHRDFYLNLEK